MKLVRQKYLVESHDGESPGHTHVLVLQRRTGRESKVDLVVSSDELRRSGRLVGVEGGKDGIGNVALPLAVLKDGVALNGILHHCALLALGKELSLTVEDAIGDLFASLGQTLEEDGKGGDGLGEDTGLLLGAEVRKDLGRLLLKEGLGVCVEDGLEKAVEDLAAVEVDLGADVKVEDGRDLAEGAEEDLEGAEVVGDGNVALLDGKDLDGSVDSSFSC